MIMIVAMKRSSDILCLTRENEMSNSHSESQCNRYLNCTERSLASLVQVHWIMNTLPLPTGMARQLFQFQAMQDNIFWILNTPTVLILLQSRLRMFLQMVITCRESWNILFDKTCPVSCAKHDIGCVEEKRGLPAIVPVPRRCNNNVK